MGTPVGTPVGKRESSHDALLVYLDSERVRVADLHVDGERQVGEHPLNDEGPLRISKIFEESDHLCVVGAAGCMTTASVP